MASGDEFQVVFDAMDSAFSNAQKAGSEISNQVEEQTHRMQNMLSGAWTDAAADANVVSYQLQQKLAGAHVDAMHAEGNAFRQVGEIGQNTLQQALRIVQG